jgi:hypothetical protein
MNRLLYCFRATTAFPRRGNSYGGWEDAKDGLRGLHDRRLDARVGRAGPPAGRGATMARARFEEAVGPEARLFHRSLEPHPVSITLLLRKPLFSL